MVEATEGKRRSGGPQPGAGRPRNVEKAIAKALRQEDVAQIRERATMELAMAKAGMRELAGQCLAPLARLIQQGDTTAIGMVLRYTMMTPREEAQTAQEDALQQLAALAGTDIPTLLRGGVTDLLARAAGVSAFAGLYALARKGDATAMRYLTEQCLPETVGTTTMRSAAMSLEDVREAMVQEYLAMGRTEDEARRLVADAEEAAARKALAGDGGG